MHCATSWTVRESTPGGVTGDFFRGPPTESYALRWNQPLKVSNREFSWGKCGRCVCLPNYHACSAEMSRKYGALTYSEPLESPRPVAEDLYFLIKLPKASVLISVISDRKQLVGIVEFLAKSASIERPWKQVNSEG